MNNQNIAKFLIAFVSISGTFSVLFGAWLAHGGQALDNEVQFRLQQALNYQFLHTLALLAVLVFYFQQQNGRLLIAALGFTLGIILFSGSLYLKTLLDISTFGKLAPVGGLTLAIAWLSLLLGIAQMKIGHKK